MVTADAIRQHWARFRVCTPADVTRGRPILVLSPHPDDESLGMGGIIAAARSAGTDVRVVVVSDGSQSHPGSRRYPSDRLAQLRRDEMALAADHLGLAPGSVTHLGLPDAAVPSQGRAFDEAVARIAAITTEAGVASLFVTWVRDPHCDHEAAAAMAHALRARMPDLNCWFYPIWGWHLDPAADIDEEIPEGFRVDIAPWLAVKRAAIEAHASQMTDLIDDDPEGFRFDAQMLAPFLLSHEIIFPMPRP